MASVDFFQENNHAMRIHYILLNIVNDVIRLALKRHVNNISSEVNKFLKDKHEGMKNYVSRYNKDFFNQIDKYYKQNSTYPQDFKIFDTSALYCISRNLSDFKPKKGWKSKLEHYHDIVNDASLPACIDNIHLIRNHFYGHLGIYEISETDYDNLIKKLKLIIKTILQISSQDLIVDYEEKINRIEKATISQENIETYRDFIKNSQETMIKFLKEHYKNQESLELIEKYSLTIKNNNQSNSNEDLKKLMDELREFDENENLNRIVANLFSDKSLKCNQYFISLESKMDSVKQEIIDSVKQDFIEHLIPIEEQISEINSKIESKHKIESYIKLMKKPNYIMNISFDDVETNLNVNKIVVLYGPPGIGKTTTAIHFADTAKEKNSIVLWFNSDRKEKFMTDLQAITESLSNPENTSYEYRLYIIKKAFGLNKNEKFLIILDNLDESDWIESFFADLPVNVCVLITSTKKSILENFAHELKVDYFDETQAREFVDKKLKKEKKVTNDEKELLDKYFTYDKILPYDLDLLISGLNNSRSINLKDLLDGYPKLCDKIFEDLYRRISEKSKLAWDILKCCSCSFIDPEAIPMFLIMEFFEIDKFQWEECTDILESNSVVETISKFDESCYRIHRRTQETIRRISNNESEKETNEKTQKIFSKLIMEKFSDFREYDESEWKIGKHLFPNILLILEDSRITLEEKAMCYYKISGYYREVAIDFDESLKFAKKALDLRKEIYGDQKHSDLAISYVSVGLTFFNKKYSKDEGLAYLEESIKILKDIHGEKNSLDLAFAYNSIGLLYGLLGNSEDSLEFLDKGLKMREAIHGDQNHLDISSSYINIGIIHSKQLSDNKTALRFFEKSLEILKEIHGEKDHPKLASVYNNIGNSYIAQGNKEKGLFNLKKALTMRKNIYRDKPHPDLAKSYSNVANCLSDIPERISNQENSIKILEIYDEKHLDLAILYNDIAASYRKQKNIEKELFYMEKALKIHEEIYREQNHPDLAKTLSKIASSYKILGDKERALEAMLKSMKIWEKMTDEKYRKDFARSCYNIGLLYRKMKDEKNGLEYLKKAIESWEEIPLDNKNNAEVAFCYNNAGLSYKEQGDIEKGMEYLKEGMAIFELIYNEKAHSDLAVSYTCVGMAYKKLAKYDSALEYLNKALDIRKTISGIKINEALAKAYNNIGWVYEDLHDFENALKFQEACMKMRESIYSDKMNKKLADSYKYVGILHLNLGNDKPKGYQYIKNWKQIYENIDCNLTFIRLCMCQVDPKNFRKAFNIAFKTCDFFNNFKNSL